MNYSASPFWVLVTTGAILVIVPAVFKARAARRRRLRAKRDPHASHEIAAAFLHPGRSEGISRERAAAITQDARSAARQAAQGGEAASPNPHAPRTREFVLWEATYHSAMSDLPDWHERTVPEEGRTGPPA